MTAPVSSTISVTTGMIRSISSQRSVKSLRNTDVVIRILTRIAARPGAEQHHTLDPFPVQLIERVAEALQNQIISESGHHSPSRSLLYPGVNSRTGWCGHSELRAAWATLQHGQVCEFRGEPA